MAEWKRTHLLLPDGWYEVRGASPRECRQAKPGSGVLQLQMLPPRPEVMGTDEQVDDALTDVLADAVDALEIGEPISCATGPCTYGRYATALFHNARMGRVRVWLLGTPGEPLLFATFVKRSPAGWEAEAADAQDILESAEMRVIEPPF